MLCWILKILNWFLYFLDFLYLRFGFWNNFSWNWFDNLFRNTFLRFLRLHRHYHVYCFVIIFRQLWEIYDILIVHLFLSLLLFKLLLKSSSSLFSDSSLIFFSVLCLLMTFLGHYCFCSFWLWWLLLCWVLLSHFFKDRLIINLIIGYRNKYEFWSDKIMIRIKRV